MGLSRFEQYGRVTRRDVLTIGTVMGVVAALFPGLRYLKSFSRDKRDGKCQPWPAWQSFVKKHIEANGRVVDYANVDLRTTSEGQAYAMFFALVNNDEGLFERLYSWTNFYLCEQRFDQRLPAWLWGQSPEKKWQVIDDNSASDADLWMAFCLLEAGRLWQRPIYRSAGMQMLQLIANGEVVQIPSLGTMLMPGIRGFVKSDSWLLNPSYLPIQILKYCTKVDVNGPWSEIMTNAIQLILGSSPKGFAPDWASWTGGDFSSDPEKGNIGSYDAIRVYLWAGMINSQDTARNHVLAQLVGPLQMLKSQGWFSERVDTTTGQGSGPMPIGFSAALLPYLAALNEDNWQQTLQKHLPSPTDPTNDALPYYERILVLFSQGWLDNRYHFAADGSLLPAWRISCSAEN